MILLLHKYSKGNFIQSENDNHSKNRILYMYHTSFHNVSASNATSGLREMVYLTIWHQNMAGKYRCQNVGQGRGRGKAHLEGPYLPKKKCKCLLSRASGGPHGLWRVYVGEITVNEKLACPVTPHPICVETGTCQGSCLEGGHWLRCTWPPWWFWWSHGTPYPLWRSYPAWWNTLQFGNGQRLCAPH